MIGTVREGGRVNRQEIDIEVQGLAGAPTSRDGCSTADRSTREHHDGRLWRSVVALLMLVGLLFRPAPLTPATVLTSLSMPARAPSLAGREVRQGAGRAPLYFPETGFAVEEPQFVEYFNGGAGVTTFGFPISRTVRFQGLPTQFFQRIVIQLGPDGAVRPLNLLDPGLLPYTQINGSTFPAPNERLAALAPSPGQPGYAQEVLEFVRRNAPETFNGQPVRFFSTFNSTVTPDVAFGPGGGDPSLLPLINLEIWGVPTSLPAQDPNNGGFIYQRFQRGIMHYDAACRCTQGLLLADYFKALHDRREPAGRPGRPGGRQPVSCASTPRTGRPASSADGVAGY